jgi:DNA-binding protein HU-beta
MNKSDLIAKVAITTGVPRTTVEKVIDATLQEIGDNLVANEPVVLRGFGSFITVARQPRVARNPKTNEVVRIPTTLVAKFRPSKDLKEAVAGR